MSETEHRARVVEVFPMRLGSEILVDVTVDLEGDPPPPRPDDTVTVETATGEFGATVWAVPRIQHPEGTRRLNLQFRQEDLAGNMPEEGLEIRW